MSVRHDMLVELATDQINSIEQMIRDGVYQDVHNWLHPILLRELKLDYADWSDTDLQDYYCDQLGVDIPSSPSLSSTNEETQDVNQTETSKETSNHGSLSEPSRMERRSLSRVYPVSNAESLAEVATALRSIARREKTIQGFEPTTEIRIPMRLLFWLVHGEGRIG